MNQIEVQIMGQSYLLASSKESERLLRQAVATVDTAMCQIRDSGKIKARERIAVLAALNIAAQSLIASTPEAATDNSITTIAAKGDSTQVDHGATKKNDYATLMARMDAALASDT